MRNQKSGLLVVVFNKEGSGIAEWFEYSRENPDEVINLLKYMRKKYNAYWWGEYKMYRRCRNITLSQSGHVNADYEGKFREIKPRKSN